MVSGFLGKFVPDVKPITVVFVDALTTDFYFYGADKSMSYVVDPTEATIRRTSAFFYAGYCGKSYLEVYTVD